MQRSWCCIVIYISITTIHIQMQYKYSGDSVVQVRTRLLTSDFGSSTRGERQNSYYADPTPNVRHISRCLRSPFIFAGRDPKNLTASSTVENSTRCPNGRELNFLPFMVQYQLSTLFFKILKFSGPSLLGMTLSTLQSHFLSGGLLWQWWLSYPMRTSVNCTDWLCYVSIETVSHFGIVTTVDEIRDYDA